MNKRRKWMFKVIVLGFLFACTELVFGESPPLVEDAQHLNSFTAWRQFVEQNPPTQTEDNRQSIASFVPDRFVVIPMEPDFACKAQQTMVGSGKPDPITPGQKVLLVRYSLDYGKPLWRVVLGILLGRPQRPPDHFSLEIAIRLQTLDMQKGELTSYPLLLAKSNTARRDGELKDLFKDLTEELKDAAPSLLDMIGKAEKMIIQVGQVIDGEKGGIKDELRRQIALSQIRAPDWKMRQRGAEALSKVLHKEDIKVMLGLLDDEKSWVSRSLVREINRGAAKRRRELNRQMLPFFRAAMLSEDSWTRAVITEAIGKTKIPEAFSMILVAAKDKEDSVRRAAASALGHLGKEEGIDTLVTMLDDEDGGTAKAAAKALKKLGWEPPDMKMRVQYLVAADKENDIVALGASSVPILVDFLAHASEDLLPTAIDSLGKIGDKTAVEPLINILAGTKSRLRVSSAEALGAIGDPRATVPLMACLKESGSSLRSAAAEALGKIKDAKAVDALIGALDDKNKYTRLAAVKALGAIGEVRAAKAVSKLLKDPNEKVKKAAAEVLQTFNWQPADPAAKVKSFLAAGNQKGILEMGEAAVGPLIDMLAGDSLSQRMDAIRLLGEISQAADRAVLPICGCLNSKDEKEVIVAAKALAKMGDSAASTYIRKALASHHKPDRASLWMNFALARLNEQRDEYIDALVKALSSDLAFTAAQALSEIEFKKEEFDIIANYLSSPDPKLRLQAATILGKVGTRETTELLWMRLTQEEDQSIRKALRKAIRSLSKNR